MTDERATKPRKKRLAKQRAKKIAAGELTESGKRPTASKKRSERKRADAKPKKKRASKKDPKRGLEIIHEDRDILVVDKPTGLLTVGTDSEKTRTAYYALTDYVRKGQAKSRNRIFVVHRLDRETSGILVFAKTPEAKMTLQRQWDKTKKRYLAVVEGRWEDARGTIDNHLAENAAHRVYATDADRGRRARTRYRLIKATERASLLELELVTGRKHQLRVHLADAGHPILGDRKYGKKTTRSKRIALHALSIAFRHPYSGKPCTFTTEAPGFLEGLVGGLATGKTTR